MKIDENLKVVTQWIEYNDDWWLIGQVNEQGQPHGVARLIRTDTLWIFEGSFLNGKKHGFGREMWSDRYVYIGDWKDGKWHGQGT